MSNFSIPNYDSWKLANPYDEAEEICDGCGRTERKCRCQDIDWEIENEKLSEKEGQ